MIVTRRYIGIERGGMNYLFFLLTEDYVQTNRTIADTLHPLLEGFARDLNRTGAFVRPFPGDEQATKDDVLKKNWTNDQVMGWMREKLPAILVIDVDFDKFQPDGSNYVLISLRDSMDDFGNVKIFQLQELLDVLAEACQRPDLFRSAREYITAQDAEELWDAVELKPGWMGFSFDLKNAIKFLRLQHQRRKQEFGTG